jgi:hypothetical protein
MDIKDYYYTSYIFNYTLPVGFAVYNICQTTSNVSWMNNVMPSKQATWFTRVACFDGIISIDNNMVSSAIWI